MTEGSPNVLERNLYRLVPGLAKRILNSLPHPDVVIRRSRSGHTVFGLPTVPDAGSSGQSAIRFFHSTYDPIKEAGRLAAGIKAGSTVVILGLGSGHHIDPILNAAGKVLIVEPDVRLIRSAVELVDLPVLSDPRVALLCTAPDELTADLANHYLPAIDGSIEVVELAGRTFHNRQLFAHYRAQIASTVDSLLDDVATQGRFGRQWLRNTCANIRLLTPRELPDFAGKPTIVTAAGPSLGQQIEEIKRRGECATLIATDTSFPHLVGRGMEPDLVVSIDCQLASYHHFLSAGRSPLLLVADLASPTAVTGCTEAVVPVLSAHPLHRLICYLCPGLPVVDSGAGTVTYAAIDLAIRGGASHVTLAGGDFSYPGAMYPRGSYVHQLFGSRANRLRPAESHHYSFLVNRPGLQQDKSEPTRYLQPSLTRYRDKVQSLVTRSTVPFTQLRGAGLELTTEPRDTSGGRGTEESLGTTEASRVRDQDWQTLPDRLIELFQRLSVDHPGTEPTHRLALTALYPYVAYLRGCGFLGSPSEVLKQAKSDTLEMLTIGPP